MLMNTITKTVTTVYTPEWVRKEFMEYSEVFRKARVGVVDICSQCFDCEGKFEDGEVMGLVSFGAHGNKLMCQYCIKDMVRVGEEM
jgi:purine-nucleoside phosphorylase